MEGVMPIDYGDLNHEDKTTVDFLLAVMACDFRLLFLKQLSQAGSLDSLELFVSDVIISQKIDVVALQALKEHFDESKIPLAEYAEKYRIQVAEQENRRKKEFLRFLTVRLGSGVGLQTD